VVAVARYLFKESPGNPTLQGIEAIDWERWPRRGINESVADIVEWSRDISGEDLVNLDTQLIAAGLPSLSQVRGQRNAT
jgi:hypothetical protein